jgi:hypothetical protein
MARKSEHLQIRVTRREKALLKRRAAAAGRDVSSYVLARVLPAPAQRFGELLELLAAEPEHRYALAELNDLLTPLGGAELRDAVAHAEVSGLSPLLRNYVAALVEQACDGRGVRVPGWTRRVEPLAAPHFAAPLESLRPHLLRASPVPFKRRNLFVDAALGARV